MKGAGGGECDDLCGRIIVASSTWVGGQVGGLTLEVSNSEEGQGLARDKR